MTGGKLEIAHLFILIAATLILFILCGLLISKAIRLYRHQLMSKYELKNQAYFVRIQRSLDQEAPLPKPEGPLDNIERAVVQTKLMAWIERVNGESRRKLISLCEEMGFIDQDIDQLRSRWSIRKIKAAYRLGRMRSKLAAPALLEQLIQQPFGSSLFIIARSLVLCSRGTDDLEKMVMQIVKHRKPVHEITAAILEEYEGDLAEVLERCLLHGNQDAKQIALQCLSKKRDSREVAAAANVLSFKDAKSKEKKKFDKRAI